MKRAILSLILLVSFSLGSVVSAEEVVVKDSLTDTSNYIDNAFEIYPIASGPAGIITSSRTFIAITPNVSGVLTKVAIPLVYDDQNNDPVNNPSPDPFDVGVAFYTDLPGTTESLEKVDIIYPTPDFGLNNPLGDDGNYKVFKLTVDVSDQSWSVEAGNTYYISLHATNTSASEIPYIQVSNNLGNVIGDIDDYFFWKIFSNNLQPLVSLFAGRTMWASQVIVEDGSQGDECDDRRRKVCNAILLRTNKTTPKCSTCYNN